MHIMQSRLDSEIRWTLPEVLLGWLLLPPGIERVLHVPRLL
jgi:hypothetical protein